MKLKKKIKALALASAITAAGGAYAAADGTLGFLSTGNTLVTLQVPYFITIDGMQDLNLGPVDPLNGNAGNFDACVWSTAAGSWSVAAYGEGAAGAYVLDGVTVPASIATYSVNVNGNAVAASDPAAPVFQAGGSAIAGATGCTNANIEVVVTGADTVGITTAEDHTGLLYVMVAPGP